MLKFKILLLSAALVGSFGAAASTSIANTANTVDSSLITTVADGCGPGGWRGQWGRCHYTPYYRVAPIYRGCPPGFWRGPWGHCRNTPYHGRMPDGSYR